MKSTGERPPLFRSFWMTAFDGADHMSVATSLGAADASQYRRRVEADYRAVCDVQARIGPLLADRHRERAP